MVDINELRGISSSEDKKQKELSEKEKKKQEVIEKGLERARPDLKARGY